MTACPMVLDNSPRCSKCTRYYSLSCQEHVAIKLYLNSEYMHRWCSRDGLLKEKPKPTQFAKPLFADRTFHRLFGLKALSNFLSNKNHK